MMMKYFTARAKGNNDPVHAGTGTQATNEYNTKNPNPSSTVPAGNTARDPVGQGGMGSVQQGSNPVSSARSPAGKLDDDVASTLQQFRPATRDTLDTNKPLPTQPSPGGSRELDTSMTSGSAPHSSGLANKADPRVGSDPYGSTGLESRETTAGGNSLPGRTTSGYAGTGATVGPAHQGDLSRSAAGNTAGTTTGGSSLTGYSEKTWSHEHNAHGHEYAGDPCADQPPAPGAPHFASGPHSLDTANRLDPHVSGGGFSGAPLSTAGIFTSSTGQDQLRRDAPLGSGATGTQSYEPSHDIPSSTTDGSMPLTGHHHPGRVAESGAGTGGPGARAGVTSRDVPSSSTTEHERTTAGPHSSDMMNQLDPRVDSDLSKQQGSSGATGTTGLGSRSMTDPSTSREHHPDRDAAATGAGGAASYEGAKHRDRDLLEGTADSGYANPYPPSSIGAGLATESSTTGASAHTDPRSTDYSTGLGSGPGSSATRNTNSTDPNTTEKDHHYARDAGIIGAGAGAGAAGSHSLEHLAQTTEETVVRVALALLVFTNPATIQAQLLG
ncbi:MAG: hypothetical protein LQ344_007731 [Seirophora lacunosa]|nr:MAG: hypothetical protein LQ344_007731 [Seirophora lacunosa]